MNAEQLIEILLEDEEYKALFEKIERNGRYDKNEALTILLALSYIQNGKGKEASELLKPIYENKNLYGDIAYWYSSALLLDAESLDDFVSAKGIMLDAIRLGLDGAMKSDGIETLCYAEEKIEYLSAKKK